MQQHRSGYTAIPGSAGLVTTKADAAIGALEHGDRARTKGAEVRGHKLGRVLVREAFVPVLADVFDRLALDQTPEEMCVYLHLWRLSVGEERNFCRVSRAELERRAQMSQLRLGKALAGLVEKRHVALVDRNRDGTLYRVMLPDEVSGTPANAKRPAAPSRSTPVPTAATSVGELVRWFLADGGGKGRRADEVLEEVLALVEEGVPLAEVQGALQRFAAEMPKKTPLAEVRRFVDVNG